MSSTTIRLGRATMLVTAGAIALALVATGPAQADPTPTSPASAAVSAAASSAVLAAATPTPTVSATPTPTVSATPTPTVSATPGPASACRIGGYQPGGVVIGASAVKRTFTVSVSGCTNPTWAVGVASFDGVFAVDYAPTVTLSPKLLKNAYAGKNVPTFVYAKGQAEPANVVSAELDSTFSLLRRATWGTSLNATPEPVRKGRTITVAGALKRVSWNETSSPPYVSYTGRTVQVQFKAAGATSYVTVAKVKTGSGGRVSAKVRAVATGRWRLVYPGGPTTGAATSSSDKVVVRN